MRINIFDNGLQSRTGHHFDTVLRLASGFRARGWEVRVCGTTQADPAIAMAVAQTGSAFIPLFSHFAYAPLDLGADVTSGIERFAHRMAAEIERAPAADLNLFPSLKPLEFLGASFSRLSGPNVGYVHAEPFHQGPYSGWAWQTAARNVTHRAMRFFIGAIDPIVADFLAGYLGGIAVETFPFMQDGPSRQHYADKAGTIGFYGSQREERGRSLISPLAERLLAQGYRVVLHDTNGQFVNTNNNPGLRIIDGFVEDLQANMLECDLVVCPMQREQYVHRMSGIACCALSSGLPFVLPAGTLSAARFMPQGSCRPYLEHSPEGILHAISELTHDYPRHAEAARQAALRWRAEHGLERFIDKVLQKLT